MQPEIAALLHQNLTHSPRLALNIKGLPYKTVWVEYPDIEPLCKKIGAKPTEVVAGVPRYTLPVIHDPTHNAVIANSIDIARYLEAMYPDTTPLFPGGLHGLHEAFQDAHQRIALRGIYHIMLPVTHTKLNPVSEVYFRRTREAKFGKKLEEFSPLGPQRDAHWAQVEEGHGVADGWLSKNEKGTYVMGETMSYADVTIAAYLLWVKAIFGVGSEEWKDILEWQGGRWASFLAQFEKYEQII